MDLTLTDILLIQEALANYHASFSESLLNEVESPDQIKPNQIHLLGRSELIIKEITKGLWLTTVNQE